MKAAIFQEAGKPLSVVDVPVPKPGPGELLLSTKGCGICGSDLHVTQLSTGVPHGAVMGHEYAGEVVVVGKDVWCPDGEWKVGDRVCTLPGIGCGQCRECAVGDIMGCSRLRTSGFGDIGGGFAEYVIAGGREAAHGLGLGVLVVGDQQWRVEELREKDEIGLVVADGIDEILGLVDDRSEAVGGAHLPLDDTDTHLAFFTVEGAWFVLVVDVAPFQQCRVLERIGVAGQVLLQYFLDVEAVG